MLATNEKTKPQQRKYKQRNKDPKKNQKEILDLKNTITKSRTPKQNKKNQLSLNGQVQEQNGGEKISEPEDGKIARVQSKHQRKID